MFVILYKVGNNPGCLLARERMTPRTWQSNVRRKQRLPNALQRKPLRSGRPRRAKQRAHAKPPARSRRVKRPADAKRQRAKRPADARRQRAKRLDVRRPRRARRPLAKRERASQPVKQLLVRRPARRRPVKRHRVARLPERKLHSFFGFFNACESRKRLAFFCFGGGSLPGAAGARCNVAGGTTPHSASCAVPVAEFFATFQRKMPSGQLRKTSSFPGHVTPRSHRTRQRMCSKKKLAKSAELVDKRRHKRLSLNGADDGVEKIDEGDDEETEAAGESES